MTRFFIGAFVPDSTHTDMLHAANEWLLVEQSDLCEWINETAGNRWSVEYEVETPTFEFESTTFGTFTFVDVFVVYEDASHAVLHKLRWE